MKPKFLNISIRDVPELLTRLCLQKNHGSVRDPVVNQKLQALAFGAAAEERAGLRPLWCCRWYSVPDVSGASWQAPCLEPYCWEKSLWWPSSTVVVAEAASEAGGTVGGGRRRGERRLQEQTSQSGKFGLPWTLMSRSVRRVNGNCMLAGVADSGCLGCGCAVPRAQVCGILQCKKGLAPTKINQL